MDLFKYNVFDKHLARPYRRSWFYTAERPHSHPIIRCAQVFGHVPTKQRRLAVHCAHCSQRASYFSFFNISSAHSRGELRAHEQQFPSSVSSFASASAYPRDIWEQIILRLNELFHDTRNSNRECPLFIWSTMAAWTLVLENEPKYFPRNGTRRRSSSSFEKMKKDDRLVGTNKSGIYIT